MTLFVEDVKFLGERNPNISGKFSHATYSNDCTVFILWSV
jgi:hypothetical protein